MKTTKTIFPQGTCFFFNRFYYVTPYPGGKGLFVIDYVVDDDSDDVVGRRNICPPQDAQSREKKKKKKGQDRRGELVFECTVQHISCLILPLSSSSSIVESKAAISPSFHTRRRRRRLRGGNKAFVLSYKTSFFQ